MKHAVKAKQKSSKDKQGDRLKKAMRDYKTLHEEIVPFIRKRKVEVHSTEGEWRESGHFCTSQDMDTLAILE